MGRLRGVGATIALLALTVSLLAAATPPATAQTSRREIPAAELVDRMRSGQEIDEQDVTITGRLDLSSLGTVSRPLRCLDCDFTGNLVGPDTIFTRIVVLSGSHFFGTIDLRGAVFEDGFFARRSSRATIFDHFSLFSLATFGDTAAFDEATFQEEGNFTGARFAGTASFVGTNFRGVARFTQADFKGAASFSGSRASGAPPSTPTCAIPVNGTFSVLALFDRAVFEGVADFRQRCFRGGAEFSTATFQGRANFSLAQLTGRAEFDDASFQGDALFLASRFRRTASFVRVAAARSMDFEDSGFLGGADFSGVTVSGSLSFANVSFGGSVDLTKVIAGDLTMDVEAVRGIAGIGVREHVLSLIETSATDRGDLAVANDAHYDLLSLENRHSSGMSKWLDLVLYRMIAGYLVRPLHPLVTFLVFLLLGAVFRAVARRRGRRTVREPRAPRRPGPSGARRVSTRPRLTGTPLAVVKWLSALFEGLGDTVSVALRPKLQIELGDREQVRSYLVAGMRWNEYLAFKILIALFLLALASSNATLRQLIESVVR